jgi:hypothetical protein
MSGITPHTDTVTGAFVGSSAVLARRSFSERQLVMPLGYGGSFGTTADSVASTAHSSATRDRSGRHSLSNRLMQSLITAGLVQGITPTSIREQCGAPIRVIASFAPAGGAQGTPGKAFSSLSA